MLDLKNNNNYRLETKLAIKPSSLSRPWLFLVSKQFSFHPHQHPPPHPLILSYHPFHMSIPKKKAALKGHTPWVVVLGVPSIGIWMS